jgi:hypothetical protein
MPLCRRKTWRQGGDKRWDEPCNPVKRGSGIRSTLLKAPPGSISSASRSGSTPWGTPTQGKPGKECPWASRPSSGPRQPGSVDISARCLRKGDDSAPPRKRCALNVSIPSAGDGATMMRRWPPKRPSSAWILHSTRTCVAGHTAVIRTKRRGGSARSTGTHATGRGHAKHLTGCSWNAIAPRRSVGIRKSRAHGARMTAMGSTGRADGADIRTRRANGPSCSSGKADAAHGVDCTANMERTWWNAPTSSPSRTGARAKPPTANSFMGMVMTSRPRKIKRSKVLLTRVTEPRSRVSRKTHARF